MYVCSICSTQLFIICGIRKSVRSLVNRISFIVLSCVFNMQPESGQYTPRKYSERNVSLRIPQPQPLALHAKTIIHTRKENIFIPLFTENLIKTFYCNGFTSCPIRTGPVSLSFKMNRKGLLISSEEATEIGYPESVVVAAAVAPTSFISKWV